MKDFCYLKGKDYIKKEILKNGPVLAHFSVFRDFINYEKGIFNTDSES